MGQVVVGYDGSTASRIALDAGAQQATLREVPLVVVTAWAMPAVSSPFAIELNPEMFREAASQTLDDAVQLVSEGHPGLDVTGRLARDDPRSALLAATTTDDLLVVGTRGRGGIVGLVLGSVAQHCIREAPCPVLVVRQPPPIS